MAGLAGIIKTVLSLENALLPKLVGFENLNPKLLLDSWKLALPLRTMPWPAKGLRRASVNCFGFGGSNAHAILDDAYHYLEERSLAGKHCSIASNKSEANGVETQETPERQAKELPSDIYKLLVFSMQDQNGLKRLFDGMATFLTEKSEKTPSLDALAYTLGTRRTLFPFRSFVVTDSVFSPSNPDFKSILSNQNKRLSRQDNVVFVFTGQGAQWALMGRELLSDVAFKASIARSQGYLNDLGCTWSAEELLRDPGPRINAAEYCQPICTILQIALVDMLAVWGITPAATVGHSSGMLIIYGQTCSRFLVSLHLISTVLIA